MTHSSTMQVNLRAELKRAVQDGAIESFVLRPEGRATVYTIEGEKFYTTGVLDTLARLSAERKAHVDELHDAWVKKGAEARAAREKYRAALREWDRIDSAAKERAT